MIRLVVRHLVQAVVTFAIVSFVMFVALFLGPNPLAELRADPQFTAADVTRITHQLGWDRPWYLQYLHWVGGLVRGHLGTSYLSHRSIAAMIAERLPLTLLLAGSALLLSAVIAVPLGLVLASKRDSTTDHTVSIASFAFLAIPNFVIALLLQLGSLEWLYATHRLVFFTAGAPQGHSLVEYARRLALPVLTLTIMQVARWTRFGRAEAIEVLDADYITSATAKGIPDRYVLFRHALPNSVLPLVTVVALDVAGVLGGAIVVERVYSLPGLGMLLLQAVTQHDVLLALDVVAVGVVLMITANLAADVVYGLVDPRTREDPGT